MVNIKWCCKQKQGISLVDQNINVSQSYLEMAKNAIGTMNREKDLNFPFAITAAYYAIYYSLYSLLMRLGIKSEIHTCTLEFMKEYLNNFYTEEDIKLINKAFNLRGIAQYYPDKSLNQEDSKLVMENANNFLNKSRLILSELNENNILEIRSKIKEILEQLK